MRIKIRNELLPLVLLVFVLIVAITFFPSNILRVILGFPFVLFFPGYVLLAAVFPKREGFSSIERVGLSFGLSIAVVTLFGLILNYTPQGIRLESILYSMASFILVISVIAWFRRKRLLKEERFGVEFHLPLPRWGMSIQEKGLYIILVLAILGALGMMGHSIMTPKVGQKFTEFYILGLESKAIDYPKRLNVGQEGRVTIGIVNHEYEIVSYRVEIMIGGAKHNEVGPVVLENYEKWEQMVSFAPQVAGAKQKVEFLLYKNGEVKSSLEPLRLWVDVSE